MNNIFTKFTQAWGKRNADVASSSGRVATIVGIAVIASVTAPVSAAPGQAVDNAVSNPAVLTSILEKMSPELRDAVINKSVAPQEFLRTSKALRLGTAPTAGTVRVMVRTSGWLGSRATRLRLAETGAKLGRTFARTGMQVIDATPEQLVALASDRAVLSISPDSPTASTSARLDVNSTSVGIPEVNRVAKQLNNGPINGRGVTVAVLDSGVAPVGDLAGKIVGFRDFVNGADSKPYDDYGHGTHVAGIVAGSGAASAGKDAKRTYSGIASGANIVGAKVLGATGEGTVSDAIAGIEWCIENRAIYNIRVINLSLGTKVRESYKTDPLCQAAERAVASGIVVVATAGNRGKYTSINSPGNDPAVITVGASNSNGTAERSDDVITTYTSRGPTAIDAAMKPDLVAPGNRVVSLRVPGSWIDRNQPQTNVPISEYSKSTGETAYAQISGSSMAAPAVAGAAALLLQVNPQMTPSGVKAALMVSAQLLSGTDPLKGTKGVYDPFTQGAGELNLPGALNVALHYQNGAGLLGAPHTTTTIAGEQFRWSLVTIRHRWRLQGASSTTLLSGPALWSSLGNTAVWTDALIWGGSVSLQYGNGVATVTNAAWGTAGDNASWNTGGDAPSFEDSSSAFDVPEEDNASWNTGGDNASWNTGGDAPVSMLLIADNASWNTGGDSPFSFAEGDLPTTEEDNASWNTGGDSADESDDAEDEEDNASWNTGGD